MSFHLNIGKVQMENDFEVTYENVKHENIDYDIVNGEIPNLSLYDFNDKINSIIICDNKSCNIDRIAKANE